MGCFAGAEDRPSADEVRLVNLSRQKKMIGNHVCFLLSIDRSMSVEANILDCLALLEICMDLNMASKAFLHALCCILYGQDSQLPGLFVVLAPWFEQSSSQFFGSPRGPQETRN